VRQRSAGAQLEATNAATARAPTPGDFFSSPGTQYGIFQHSFDYSLVTTSNPARPGEILVTYVTGIGSPLDYHVAVGTPAPLAPVDPVGQFNAGGAADTYNIVANGVPVGSIGDRPRSYSWVWRLDG